MVFPPWPWFCKENRNQEDECSGRVQGGNQWFGVSGKKQEGISCSISG
jgi:hypothetical protein